MMVCSCFAPQGYIEYGARFLETFDRHWPAAVDLAVYTEEPVVMPRGECRSLWDCDGASAFYDRHHSDPKRCGRKPIPGWRMKDKVGGYSWRFDAVKFFKQCLIPDHAAAQMQNGEALCWLDADVITFADVPAGFVDGLLGDNDLVYLGRGHYHSEIGFWAVRLNPKTRRFLNRFAEMWRSDEFFNLAEHHSAYVFDYCRRTAEARGLQSVDLTPGKGGHVWLESPLSPFTDHAKGPRRKMLGHSPEHPLKWWEKDAKQWKITSSDGRTQ